MGDVKDFDIISFTLNVLMVTWLLFSVYIAITEYRTNLSIITTPECIPQ